VSAGIVQRKGWACSQVRSQTHNYGGRSPCLPPNFEAPHTYMLPRGLAREHCFPRLKETVSADVSVSEQVPLSRNRRTQDSRVFVTNSEPRDKIRTTNFLQTRRGQTVGGSHDGASTKSIAWMRMKSRGPQRMPDYFHRSRTVVSLAIPSAPGSGWIQSR
jgi:hypothetical protein